MNINTNVQSLIGVHTLHKNHNKLANVFQRLSTGLKINRGADNPAGLIASEYLRGEIAALDAAMYNTSRADMVMNVADSGLGQVGSMLTDLKALALKNANTGAMSDAERAANQLQMDSILDSIDRVANTTQFNGTHLLNGEMGYTVDNVDTDKVADYEVYAAQGADSGVPVDVAVSQAAEQGGMFLEVDNGAGAVPGDDTLRFELTGSEGTAEFSFQAGTTLDEMAAEINQWTESTGVEAEVTNEDGVDGIRLRSAEYGSDEFVELRMDQDGGHVGNVYQLLEDQPDPADNGKVDWASGQGLDALEGGGTVEDYGEDVAGTINGHTAAGDGTTLSVSSDDLAMEIALREAAAATAGASFQAMEITGGGATYQVGPEVNSANQVNLGIGSVHTQNIGRIHHESGGNLESYSLADLRSGGRLNTVDGDAFRAVQSIDRAIHDIATRRGRIGTVQANTLRPNMNNLQASMENVTKAESAIRDADYAQETADLTRLQVLVNAGTSVLSMANAQASNVLSLL